MKTYIYAKSLRIRSLNLKRSHCMTSFIADLVHTIILLDILAYKFKTYHRPNPPNPFLSVEYMKITFKIIII